MPPNPNAAILTARPNVRFLSQAVQPPSQVYVELADVLRIAAASSQANEVLTVNYRLLLPSGDVVEGQSSLAVTSNRAINIHDEPLAEGFLLSCSCKAAAATTRGQTFARIFLTNPVLGQGQPSYMLMADYVTTAMAPAHPNGRVLAPSEGPGWARTVTVPNPGAIHDWSVTVPTNARWRIVSIFAQLATDATAGNRSTNLQISEPSGLVWNHPIAVTVPPSSFAQLNATNGCSLTTTSSAPAIFVILPTPKDLVLLSGGILNSSTSFIGALDAWSLVNMVAEEWLDNV